MRSRVFWFAALAGLTAIVCAAFARTTSAAPFAYDEADYMYAGTRGFAANYLDRGSLAMTAYFEKGLALLHDQSQRQSLSRFVRSSEDLDFYRHYHGPMYAYWIAGWQALGVRTEAAYRSTGLVLHALAAMIIFFMFLRVFPELPVQAAFVAGAIFVMNRTALVAATEITQHVAFAFLACCTLFAAAEFLRSGRAAYWYAAAALMAASFAAVEIASVLIASLIVTIVLLQWSRGFKKVLGLLARGAGCFLATLAILWPPGVFKLNALKWYMYLAYIAVARKTFRPIGPWDLWGFKLRSYPLEFVLLFAAMVAGALWLWRTGSFRRVAPFLLYAVAFFCVTLVITAPYTYYHASLTMSLAVVTGVLFGEIWNRVNSMIRAVALVAVVGSLAALDLGFYQETVRDRAEKPSGTADVLAFLSSHPPQGPLFVPIVMVPPLHYYRPEDPAIGYDENGTGEALSSQAAALDPRTTVFCGSAVCRQVDPDAAANLEQIGTLPDSNEALYAMPLARR